jgi:hypothetical protein
MRVVNTLRREATSSSNVREGGSAPIEGCAGHSEGFVAHSYGGVVASTASEGLVKHVRAESGKLGGIMKVKITFIMPPSFPLSARTCFTSPSLAVEATTPP